MKFEDLIKNTAILFICVGVAQSAFADRATWQGADYATWDTAENWSGGQIPTAESTVEFTSGLIPKVMATTSVNEMEINFSGLQGFWQDAKKQLKVVGSITGLGGILQKGANAANVSDCGRIEICCPTNTFSGGLWCETGVARYMSKTGGFIPLNTWLGTGNIYLDGGTFSINPIEVPSNMSGRPLNLNHRLVNNLICVTEKHGRLHINTSSGVNNAGYIFGDIELGGILSLLSHGGGNGHGMSLDGTITLLQDQERTLRIQNNTGHNGSEYLSGSIVDGPGEANNPLVLGATGRSLLVSGLHNSYAHGTIFEDINMYPMETLPCTMLGTGDVTFNSGAAVKMKNVAPLGEDCNLAADSMITLTKGSIAEFGSGDWLLECSRTNGSPIITFSDEWSTGNLFVGQRVTGPGIDEGTTVASIESDRQATLSVPAVETLSGEKSKLTFKGRVCNVADRITPDSAGMYGIIQQHDYDLDFSSIGNGKMYLGTISGGVFAGQLLPGSDNIYRLGGGMFLHPVGNRSNTSPSLTILGTNVLTGTASVQIGPGVEDGGVIYGQVLINAENDYTGQTLVKQGSALLIGRTGGQPFGTGLVHVESGALFGAGGPSGSFFDGAESIRNYVMHPGSIYFFNEQLLPNYLENGEHRRWNDNKPLRIVDGRFHTLIPHGSKITEKVGVFQFGDVCHFSKGSWGNGGDYILEADSFERLNHGILTAHITLGGNPSSAISRIRVTPGNEPEMENGILPPYYLNEYTGLFMRYNSSVDEKGIVGLETVPEEEYKEVNTGVSEKDIAKITTSTTLSSDVDVHALLVKSSIGGTANQSIFIHGGGMCITKKNMGFNPVINFTQSKNDAVIHCQGGVTGLGFNGGIRSTNVLIKSGGGEITLKKATPGDLSGKLVINAGKFIVDARSVADELDNCDVVINKNGILDLNTYYTRVKSLRGCGTVMDNTIIVRDEFYPGGADATSTLNAESFVLGANCESHFRVGEFGDKVVSKGVKLTLDGTMHFEKATGYEPGTYTIMTYTGTLINNGVIMGESPADMRVQLDLSEEGVVKVICTEVEAATLVIVR